MPRPERGWSLRLPSAVVIVLIAIGVVVSARVILHGVHDLFVAAENSGIEAPHPILARKVAHGQPLYQDWRSYPHDMAIYGPLFYVIPGWIARWTAMSGWRIWLLGREISAVAAAAVVLLAVLAMVRAGVRTSLVVLGVVLIIPILDIWDIAVTFRPDMPMIALSLSGVLLAGDWRGKWRWFSLAPFLAAVAYKQTAIAAPAAIVATLLLTRRTGDALRFAAALAGLVAVYLAAMQIGTHGWFLENEFGALRGSYAVEYLAEIGQRVLMYAPLVAVPGLFYAGRQLLRRAPDPLPMYAVMSLGLAIVTSGRRGSDVNYFVEGLLILAILAVMLAESAFRAYARDGLPRGVALVAPALLMFGYIPGHRFPPTPQSALPFLSPDDSERMFTDVIAPLHSAHIFPGELEVALMAGLEVPYSDGFLVDGMTVDGLLDPEEVLRRFQGEHYDYVVLPDPVVMYQHTYTVPRVLLREIQSRIDVHAGIRIAPLGAGRSVYLFRLAPPKGSQ